MSQERIQSFDQFWPVYLQHHSQPTTRFLHFAGLGAAGMLLSAGVILQQWALALLAIPTAYAFCWVGHFFFEKNQPTTFHHPLWSVMGYFKMFALTFTGQMGHESQRVLRSRAHG